MFLWHHPPVLSTPPRKLMLDSLVLDGAGYVAPPQNICRYSIVGAPRQRRPARRDSITNLRGGVLRIAFRWALAGAALVVAVAAWPTLASAQRNEERRIEMRIGDQEVIEAEGARSYSPGTPGIVDVRPDGSNLVVVGIAQGDTTLLVLGQDGQQINYRIRVSDEYAPGDDNIRLDFYFIQVDESYAHQIGVGWPATLGAGSSLSFGYDFQASAFSNATAVVSQPLPRIDLLQATGWARIMRQAAVIAANNTEATFSSGGELNVPVAGNFGGTLQQVSFGSNVRVRPRYNKSTGRISLRITAEVSDLTDDRGTGVPGRTVSNIDTLVNLEMGQAVLLAGLIAESTASSQTGLPGLSQIPILGILFGSNSRQQQATQNVLFIVPTVVDVVPSAARSRIQDALEVYWEYSGGLDELQLLPTTSAIPAGTRAGNRASPAGRASPTTPRRSRPQE